jgi:DNA-directed RNA polymerase specialized sigma24 family protein
MSTTGNFAATRWTLVVQSRGDDAAARAALSELCSAYYAPVVSFLRATGRDEDAAREMAHDFFARVLANNSLGGADPARGRFRSYLLGAVKHFVADVRDRALTEKRGAGVEPVPLDAGTATTPGLEVPAPAVDEAVFDRQWALTVIARALDVVGTELRDAGKAEQFEVLKPWISGGAISPQAEVAERLGMNEGALKVAIHRLRQRFREVVKAEIAHTVPAESDVDDELRHLIAVLARQ